MIVPRSGVAIGIDQLQMELMIAQRETIKTGHDAEQAASDRKFNSQRARSAQRIEHMEKQLEAAKVDLFSFIGGAAVGVFSGFTSALAMPLAGPIIGVLPAFQGAASLLIHAPAALLSGAMSGMTLGNGTKTLAAPWSAMLKNQAADAELRSAQLEQEIAHGEAVEQNAGSSVEAAKKALRDARQAIDELRRTEHEIAGARWRSSDGEIVFSAASASPALQQAMRIAKELELTAREDERRAQADASDLQIRSLEAKRAAIEERKANETKRAVLGMVRLGVEVASAVATAGSSQLVSSGVQLASAGVGVAESLVTDQGVRSKDREAEELRIQAKRADAHAKEGRAEADSWSDVGDRAGRIFKDASSAGKKGTQIMGSNLSGVGQLAMVIARAALEEERGARDDQKRAREGKLALEQGAVSEKRKADSEQNEIEAFNRAVSIIGALASAGGGDLQEAAKLTKVEAIADVAETIEKITKLANQMQPAIEAIHTYPREKNARELMRRAEELDVQAKAAEGREDDAREVREDAKERRQRALDLAVAANRGSGPV